MANINVYPISTGIEFRGQNPTSVDVRGAFQQHSRSDIAHLHMRILEIERVGQSARILPIHVKEGVKRGHSTSFFHSCKRQELGHEKFWKLRTKNAPLILTSKVGSQRYIELFWRRRFIHVAVKWIKVWMSHPYYFDEQQQLLSFLRFLQIK